MRLRRLAFAAATIVCALVAFDDSARACDRCAAPVPKPHLIDSLSFGWCSRLDANVGANGMCAELAMGFDYAFRPHVATFHLIGDLGFGSTVGAQTLAIVGTSRGSGGPYWDTRVMLGYDITHLFFIRLGFQLKEAIALRTFGTGMQLVADMGTRALGRFEVGFRGYVGFDGEVTRDADMGAIPTLAIGIVLFSRVIVR